MTGLQLSVLTHPLPALCTVAPGLRSRFGVRDRISDPYGVALTFDDGPDPEGTPRVLHALEAMGVVATFFVTGEQVRDHPSVAAHAVAAGHEIAVKGDRHRNVLRVSPWTLREDLHRAEDAIVTATGIRPRLYRPPYGVLSAAALSLATEHGWEPVLWTRWGHDSRATASAVSIAADLTRDLAGGEILMLHDADRYSVPLSWRRMLTALPAIVDDIRSAGFEFRPIGSSLSG
ncbi:polysaccharide deacetylase family protein [Baekduia sp.]|jgi:peptidoglycan/xylan/chitin deacetylase (PgdA/CDA1 family)|uniref:polysaccharide deacetylase family protein n=1 Tax=Baekduia sp. TaxID=2600305 RepID=UPI002E0B8E3F|nr:polysaccharide deacetylase family protein [Baekduia sp.]